MGATDGLAHPRLSRLNKSQVSTLLTSHCFSNDTQVLEMSCPSQCSGHGECLSGFCKCHEGWYGTECARRRAGMEMEPGGVWAAGCRCGQHLQLQTALPCQRRYHVHPMLDIIDSACSSSAVIAAFRSRDSEAMDPGSRDTSAGCRCELIAGCVNLWGIVVHLWSHPACPTADSP